MSSLENRLKDLGYSLPEAKAPLYSYVPITQYEKLLFISGQLPRVNGEMKWAGKVGKQVMLEEAQQASILCIINALAQIKNFTGSLDSIERIIQLRGFVNSAKGFNRQPSVIDGASNFLLALLNDQGRHARTAIGVSELPQDSSVEIDMIIQVK